MATVLLQLKVQEDRLIAVKELLHGIKGVQIQEPSAAKAALLADVAASVEELNQALAGQKKLKPARQALDQLELQA